MAKSKQTGSVRASKPGGSKSASSPAARESQQKLDAIGDSPESGEPLEQGRSRGRVVDRPAGTGTKQSPSKASGQSGGKNPSSRSRAGRSGSDDPRAATERDESGNTANEAWESGRQKAAP